MLQEAMKTLEDAEAKAAEIVKEAGKKAEAIQAEAKENLRLPLIFLTFPFSASTDNRNS